MIDADLSSEIILPGDDRDPARELWNPRQETMPPEQMRELQLRKLKTQLPYLAQNSILYQRKFAAAGLRPEDIRSIDDLQHVPFTTKAELRDGQDEHPPFGLHQAAPMERIIRVTSTAGTTGS